MRQRAFVLHQADNVATALDDLVEGPIELIGESALREIYCIEPIKFGYKIALADFAPEAEVIKNNVIIARAFLDIRQGQMVHLHNIRSQFDERSGTLDHDTGAPTEDIYR